LVVLGWRCTGFFFWTFLLTFLAAIVSLLLERRTAMDRAKEQVAMPFAFGTTLGAALRCRFFHHVLID
jgi:hypothetical protein